MPETLAVDIAPRMSTQEGFGRIMNELGRADTELARRIVTTAPDVATSTNLGTWVNRHGVSDRRERGDQFAEAQVVSPQKWSVGPKGQHIELGIAENNLFIMLGALGLSGSLFNLTNERGGPPFRIRHFAFRIRHSALLLTSR